MRGCRRNRSVGSDSIRPLQGPIHRREDGRTPDSDIMADVRYRVDFTSIEISIVIIIDSGFNLVTTILAVSTC